MAHLDIASIDRWAYEGRSLLHLASPSSKVFLMGAILASILLSYDLRLLVGIYLIGLLLSWIAGLPLLRMMTLAAYPAAFALLFALSQTGGGWKPPLLVLMKAQAAALTLLLLLGTTGYPQVFGLASHLLPRILSDGLLLTYRLFFVLLELIDRFLSAVRLRGGLSSLRLSTNLKQVAQGLGALFVLSFEKSQRLYDVMYLRGYRGQIVPSSPLRLKPGDWLPLGVGGGILAIAILLRIGK
ncbi:MAG: energy-coupling factor transporter transmembrane component T [candidate division NC10 bacterium]|nr:energy-coupling factor transporter transmembrane component T [candidate division NC10 bacterium]